MNKTKLVGVGQRIGNLRRKADCLLWQQRSLRQAALQCFTLDQLHDEEVHAILMTDVMQRADVRMREFRNSFRFAVQSLP